MRRRTYRRWHREWDWGKRRPGPSDVGRWSAGIDLSGLNRPYLTWNGEGDDWAYVAIGFGSPGSDPVLRLEVDLEGTRLGRWLAWACWRGRQAQWWLRHRHDAPATDEVASQSQDGEQPHNDEPGATAHPE